MTKMRKFFIFIFPLFLLISCSTTQEDQPAEDLLATQVAVILTETANQATHTETETKVPMLTATKIETIMTSTATSTLTPTATITKAPSDPAVMLGSPAWTYDFSGTSSPWDYESEQALFETSNGYLNITARSNPNWYNWWVSSPRLKDAYVEAKIEMGGCGGYDRFGLAIRGSSDGEQFYFMELTCDGSWGFFRMAPDVEIITIKEYQDAGFLDKLWNDPHRIGIWMDGSDFRFYFDGEEIGSANDNELSGEGYTGFLIAYAETPGYTVAVDTLQYWNIP